MLCGSASAFAGAEVHPYPLDFEGETIILMESGGEPAGHFNPSLAFGADGRPCVAANYFNGDDGAGDIEFADVPVRLEKPQKVKDAGQDSRFSVARDRSPGGCARRSQSQR